MFFFFSSGRFDSYHYQHRVSCWKKIDSAGKCSDLGSEVLLNLSRIYNCSIATCLVLSLLLLLLFG